MISPEELSYGFTESDLVFDPLTLDQAPDCSALDLLADLNDPDQFGHAENAAPRTLTMALALFTKVSADPIYEGIGLENLFGACLHTAMIWECG